MGHWHSLVTKGECETTSIKCSDKFSAIKRSLEGDLIMASKNYEFVQFNNSNNSSIYICVYTHTYIHTYMYVVRCQVLFQILYRH